MAKQSSSPESKFELTLNEFCARLSRTDSRVELISGFHYVEQAAGNIKDTADKFQARFDEFVDQPVAR